MDAASNVSFSRSVETEVEFRVVVNAATYRMLLANLFDGKDVVLYEYRITRHCISSRRIGCSRKFKKFQVNNHSPMKFIEYVNSGHVRNEENYFDQLKYTLCGHTVYRYDKFVPHCSNVRWPRIFVCKRSVELDNVDFSDEILKFLEVDGSDANLGIVHVKRFEFCSSLGIRVGLYSFMNDFSEVRYEIALEMELASVIDDNTFRFISSYFYDYIEPWLQFDLRTPIDPLLVNKSEHYMRVISSSTAARNDSDTIIVGYKAKLDGVRLFATFDGTHLILSDGSRKMIHERSRFLFGIDYVYQVERFSNDVVCITEICAVRNVYVSVQNSLAHGFYASDVLRGKFRVEQKFPYGFLGLGLPDKIINDIAADLEKVRCCDVSQTAADANSLIRIDPVQSAYFCNAANRSLRGSDICFNVLRTTITEAISILPSDGVLMLVKNRIESTNSSSCPFDDFVDDYKKMLYVKLKTEQSIELRFVNYVDESGMQQKFFAALDGMYIFFRGEKWFRYDGAAIELHNFVVALFHAGDIVEFSRVSSQELRFLRVRNDKLMPDCLEKVDSIVFERGYDDRSENECFAFDETDEKK